MSAKTCSTNIVTARNTFSDAPHRTAVSMALLRLSESGKLMELKDRWWSVPEEQKCPVTFLPVARLKTQNETDVTTLMTAFRRQKTIRQSWT